MATHKPAPLRDRLLSNSPDPIKSSILRESGMGWASSTTGAVTSPSGTGSITSPLRIAKRDSPAIQRDAGVARRSSSSFKHVRNNNLVSKSPFKTQIPTPFSPSRPASVQFPTRRVSGEKRPRPSSMHEDAENENDRPFSLKRDRKQSKTFQGLLQKEPVTKSPFKQLERMTSEDEGLSFQPPLVSKIPLPTHTTPNTTVTPHLAPANNASPSVPSPARSSLVSRRLHGPRLSGTGRREPRKVKFNLRCDVVEFDRETSEEPSDESDEECYGEPYQDAEEGDPFFGGRQAIDAPPQPGSQVPEGLLVEDDSYESIQLSDAGRNAAAETLLDRDTSITGLVEEMFFSSNAALINVDSLGSSTPPRVSDIPTDLETEDGVPFGRSHHVERLLQHRQQPSPQLNHPPPRFSPHHSPQVSQPPSQHDSPQVVNNLPYPYNLGLPTHASPHGPPATPPRPSPGFSQSTPPLGRSTHTERVLKAREEEKGEAQEMDANAEKLPISPSPAKVSRISVSRDEGLIPKFKWPRGSQSADRKLYSTGSDPFEEPREHEPSLDEHKSSNDSMDPANLSIGNSEISLSGLDRGSIYHSGDEVPSESELGNSSFLLDDVQRGTSCSLPIDTSREEGSAQISIDEDGSARRVSSGSLSYSEIPSGVDCPTPHTSSPSLSVSQSGSSQTHSRRSIVRQRISKEDVRRRLSERSTSSATPEPVTPSIPRQTKSPLALGIHGEVIEHQQFGEPYDKESESKNHCEKERDRMSIATTLTDISTEPATIQHGERLNLAVSPPAQNQDKEFGLLSAGPDLQVNFGSKFSLGGLGFSKNDSTDSRGRLEASTRDIGAKSRGTNSGGNVKVGDVDVDMDMKSALDRLMDDVAGAGGHGNDSILTDDYDESYDQSMELSQHKIQRAATDSALMQIKEASDRIVSGSSNLSIPPPVPPKDNIKAREQLILEKRRESRRAEEGSFLPTRGRGQQLQSQLGLGRPSRRRSMSTGDAQDMSRRRVDASLNVGDMGKLVEEDPLSDSIERELRKLDNEPVARKSKYHIREREGTIYASASDDKISHMAGPGDVDAGKAWRTVRRPSDMNEYSKQIKEYRSQANPAKAYGKVFVKVVGIKGVHLPLPQQPTALTCTLNNGIHFVTTPECELSPDCRINQEFELIEHSKLEFTLTLKICRDPHIIAQFKDLVPAPAPPPPPPPVQQSSSRGGVRAFFSSSPKKASKEKVPQPPPAPAPALQRLPENLARYLKPDGTLARAFIQFKDISTRCDTRLFETSYPLIGQRVELGGKFSTLQVGEIILQLFRLPPLPGIPSDQLPQSLDECHRGLRHINWHKMTYFQGTLTQSGGDCSTWRRRHFRVIGASLVAFNDVTKKATATIDLKKALAVQDDQDLRNPLSPSREYDDDGHFGVERSFRLVFPQGQEIIFFADTDEEKYRWLEVLRALVGHIPPHPLWAELLWQRQEEISRPPNPTNNSSRSAQGVAGVGQQR